MALFIPPKTWREKKQISFNRLMDNNCVTLTQWVTIKKNKYDKCNMDLKGLC